MTQYHLRRTDVYPNHLLFITSSPTILIVFILPLFPLTSRQNLSPNLNSAEMHNKILISDNFAKSFITGAQDDFMLQRCLASLWEFSLLDEEIPTGFWSGLARFR